MNLENKASEVSTGTEVTATQKAIVAYGEAVKLEDVVLNPVRPEGKPEILGNFVAAEDGDNSVRFTLKGEFFCQFKLASDGTVYCSSIKSRMFEADIANFSETARQSKALLLRSFVPKPAAIAASARGGTKVPAGPTLTEKLAGLKFAFEAGVYTKDEYLAELKKLTSF